MHQKSVIYEYFICVYVLRSFSSVQYRAARAPYISPFIYNEFPVGRQIWWMLENDFIEQEIPH